MIYFYLNTSSYYLFSLSHFILCSLIWINHIFWYHSMSFLPLLGYIFLTILFKSYLTDYKMNLWFNKAINISTIIAFCIIQRSSNTNSIDLSKFCATVSILSFFQYTTVKSHLLRNTDFLKRPGQLSCRMSHLQDSLVSCWFYLFCSSILFTSWKSEASSS